MGRSPHALDRLIRNLRIAEEYGEMAREGGTCGRTKLEVVEPLQFRYQTSPTKGLYIIVVKKYNRRNSRLGVHIPWSG